MKNTNGINVCLLIKRLICRHIKIKHIIAYAFLVLESNVRRKGPAKQQRMPDTGNVSL